MDKFRQVSTCFGIHLFTEMLPGPEDFTDTKLWEYRCCKFPGRKRSLPGPSLPYSYSTFPSATSSECIVEGMSPSLHARPRLSCWKPGKVSTSSRPNILNFEALIHHIWSKRTSKSSFKSGESMRKSFDAASAKICQASWNRVKGRCPWSISDRAAQSPLGSSLFEESPPSGESVSLLQTRLHKIHDRPHRSSANVSCLRRKADPEQDLYDVEVPNSRSNWLRHFVTSV